MVLGWQGFELEHPDEWAPVHLSGNRDEGYVRVASPGRMAGQLRWRKAANADGLPDRLSAYLTRLQRDAKKAGKAFDGNVVEGEDRLGYRYSGSTYGRGAIFYSETCLRVFFAEVVSTKSESLTTPLRNLLSGFRSVRGDNDRWALLGLDVTLPPGLTVEKTTLLAGHTRIDLATRGVHIRAERWGFGEQLIERHGLPEWARASLGLPKAIADEELDGKVHLRHNQFFAQPVEALALFQPDRNQITTITVTSRNPSWRPQWDWIG